MLAGFADEYKAIDVVVRTIPSSVSMALADGTNDAALIEDLMRRHVYLALCGLSDTTPEPQTEGKSELAVASTVKAITNS
jgi:hypothetical protein